MAQGWVGADARAEAHHPAQRNICPQDDPLRRPEADNSVRSPVNAVMARPRHIDRRTFSAAARQAILSPKADNSVRWTPSLPT